MIHKVNTGWLRSVVGNTIGATFADAWSSIINALEGAWGTVNAPVIGDSDIDRTDYTVIKGKYTGVLDTSRTGAVTVSLPYESDGISKVLVEEVVGDVVTSSTTYLVNNNQSIDITLSGDRTLITVTGTARRI